MKKITIIFCSIFIGLFLTGNSCVETFYSINIKNDSTSDIIVCGGYILPDTILPATSPLVATVKAKKNGAIYDFELGDKEFKRFEKETTTIFIIDKQVYKTQSWDSIRTYNKILKRYELNLQDYRAMGSTITYP